MARFAGMLWRKGRASKLLALALSLGLLTGCSVTKFDQFRPEVNNSHDMVTDPRFWLESEELENQDGTEVNDNERVSGSEVESNPYTPDIDATENFEMGRYSPLPYDVVSSTEYAAYLRSNIFEPVQTLIAEAAGTHPDVYDDIYFRVYHTGYDAAPEGSDVSIIESASFDMREPRNAKFTMLGGSSFTDFAYSYLTKSYGNQLLRDSAVDRFKRSMSVFDQSMSLDEAKINENMPASVVSMWSSEENSSCATLADFVRKTESSPEKTLARMELRMLTSATGSTLVTFNPTEGRLPYQQGITCGNANKVFNSTCQFTDKTYNVTVTANNEDEQGICWAYVDNYSTTIVMLGCTQSKTLSEALGYSTVQAISSTISSAASWNQVSQVSSALPTGTNPTIIKKGVREG